MQLKNDKIVINPRERERNQTIKQNFSAFWWTRKKQKEKGSVCKFEIKKRVTRRIGLEFESGRPYEIPVNKNNDNNDDIAVYIT
jgi:hypothetical protein